WKDRQEGGDAPAHLGASVDDVLLHDHDSERDSLLSDDNPSKAVTFSFSDRKQPPAIRPVPDATENGSCNDERSLTASFSIRYQFSKHDVKEIAGCFETSDAVE